MLAAQRRQSLACRPDACVVAHAVKRVRDVKAHGTLPPSDRSRSAGTSTSSSSTATAAAAAVHDGAVSMAPLPASSQTEVPKSHAKQLAQEHQASQAFVNLFRQASPYIEGHRGRTFVITLPGQVGAGSRQAGSGRQLPHTACMQLPACTRHADWHGGRCRAYHLENRRGNSSTACGVWVTCPLSPLTHPPLIQQHRHTLIPFIHTAASTCIHPLAAHSCSNINMRGSFTHPLKQQHHCGLAP